MQQLLMGAENQAVLHLLGVVNMRRQCCNATKKLSKCKQRCRGQYLLEGDSLLWDDGQHPCKKVPSLSRHVGWNREHPLQDLLAQLLQIDSWLKTQDLSVKTRRQLPCRGAARGNRHLYQDHVRLDSDLLHDGRPFYCCGHCRGGWR